MAYLIQPDFDATDAEAAVLAKEYFHIRQNSAIHAWKKTGLRYDRPQACQLFANYFTFSPAHSHVHTLDELPGIHELRDKLAGIHPHYFTLLGTCKDHEVQVIITDALVEKNARAQVDALPLGSFEQELDAEYARRRALFDHMSEAVNAQTPGLNFNLGELFKKVSYYQGRVIGGAPVIIPQLRVFEGHPEEDDKKKYLPIGNGYPWFMFDSGTVRVSGYGVNLGFIIRKTTDKEELPKALYSPAIAIDQRILRQLKHYPREQELLAPLREIFKYGSHDPVHSAMTYNIEPDEVLPASGYAGQHVISNAYDEKEAEWDALEAVYDVEKLHPNVKHNQVYPPTIEQHAERFQSMGLKAVFEHQKEHPEKYAQYALKSHLLQEAETFLRELAKFKRFVAGQRNQQVANNMTACLATAMMGRLCRGINPANKKLKKTLSDAVDTLDLPPYAPQIKDIKTIYFWERHREPWNKEQKPYAITLLERMTKQSFPEQAENYPSVPLTGFDGLLARTLCEGSDAAAWVHQPTDLPTTRMTVAFHNIFRDDVPPAITHTLVS